jgi:predicted patatin/cPLA2 family phospholipase
MHTILLGGGGVRCFAYVGALHYLHKTNQLQLIRNLIGVSGGALICTVLAIGLTPQDAYNTMRARNSLHGIFESNDWIENTLTLLLLMAGYPKNATFRDVHQRTGKFLGIVATDVYKAKPMYFSHLDTPNVSIIDAVRASSAIPIVFPPVWINDSMFVDGAISDPNPVEWIKSKLSCNRCDMICLYVKDGTNQNESLYWTRLLKMCLQRLLNVMDEDAIVFSFDNVSAVDNISSDIIDEIVRFGYLTMSKRRRHIRRQSV